MIIVLILPFNYNCNYWKVEQVLTQIIVGIVSWAGLPLIREIRKNLQKIYETHIVTFGTKVTKHTGFSQHGGWSLISVFCFGCYSNLIGQGRMLLQNIPTPWGRKSNPALQVSNFAYQIFEFKWHNFGFYLHNPVGRTKSIVDSGCGSVSEEVILWSRELSVTEIHQTSAYISIT